MFIKVCILVLALGCARADNDVVVIRQVVPYDQQNVLGLNSSIEYILEFSPDAEQQLYPGRLALTLSSGDINYPVLVTARQRTGAVTWQLPYTAGDDLKLSMERTLCFFDSNGDIDTSECAGTETYRRNGFSLHIATTCQTDIGLTVTATPARDWLITDSSTLAATLESPAVRYYTFADDVEKVRLVLAADDQLCALVSIQNRTCPIQQSDVTAQTIGLRMTMLKSAGVQLARKNYPNGFYLMILVLSSDETCLGDEAVQDDWLWSRVFLGEEEEKQVVAARTKIVTVSVKAALTKGQYAIASTVTLLVFLLFYIAFLLLVYAQRWPRFAKYMLPLGPPTELANEQSAISTIEGATSPSRRQRRVSTATFDSSDNSDSEDEDDVTTAQSNDATTPRNEITSSLTNYNASRSSDVDIILQNTTNGVEGVVNRDTVTQQSTQPIDGATVTAPPFGLPTQLRVAALSRKRGRVLKARSDRYLTTLYTVAVFYALPVLQFVAAFQIFLNVSGSLDTCYYNYQCAHPAGALSDFNHVYSNLGYLALGALFLLQVRRRRRRLRSRSEEYGIPPHYGMLSALGAGLMMVALLSACYHVCPNRLNFQFDTAFMYVLSVLCMVKIYQSRHPDVNARAHATFGVLAVLMALVVWGVLGGGPMFWAFVAILHIFTFLLLSLRIYYVGQFRLEKHTLQMAARGLAQVPKFGVKPLYKTRLIMLLIANVVNWGFALYGLWTQQADFASHLLSILLGNTLLYMIFYWVMKLLHGERPRWYAWCFLVTAAIFWMPALYMFVSGNSDWSTTPALSRHKNHECYVLQFYDSHDLWHMLSAVALFLTFNVLLTWDDGLAAVKRTEIAVF